MISASPTWMMLLYIVILLTTISVTSGKCQESVAEVAREMHKTESKEM